MNAVVFRWLVQWYSVEICWTNSIRSCWSCLLVWIDEGFEIWGWNLWCLWPLVSCLDLGRIFSGLISHVLLSRLVVACWRTLQLPIDLSYVRLWLDHLWFIFCLRWTVYLWFIEFSWLHQLTLRSLNRSFIWIFVSLSISLSLGDTNSLLRWSLLMTFSHEASQALFLRNFFSWGLFFNFLIIRPPIALLLSCHKTSTKLGIRGLSYAWFCCSWCRLYLLQEPFLSSLQSINICSLSLQYFLRDRLSACSPTSHTLGQCNRCLSLSFISGWSCFSARSRSIPAIYSRPSLLDLRLELACLFLYLLCAIKCWDSNWVLISDCWLRWILWSFIWENVSSYITESCIRSEIDIDWLCCWTSSLTARCVDYLFRTSKSWLINHIFDVYHILNTLFPLNFYDVFRLITRCVESFEWSSWVPLDRLVGKHWGSDLDAANAFVDYILCPWFLYELLQLMQVFALDRAVSLEWFNRLSGLVLSWHSFLVLVKLSVWLNRSFRLTPWVVVL